MNEPQNKLPAANPADAAATEQRLARLFRRALGEQRLHPLYALLRRHRGLTDALPPAHTRPEPS